MDISCRAVMKIGDIWEEQKGFLTMEIHTEHNIIVKFSLSKCYAQDLLEKLKLAVFF